MNQSARLVESPYLVQQHNRESTILAWVVTLLISTLPDIAWIEMTGSTPPWLTEAKMGLLLILGVSAFFWKPIRPLRNFFLVMFAFFGLMELRLRFNFTFAPLQALFGHSVFDERMQAEQTGKLAVALVMISVLLVLGYKRRDFFLTRGNLRAPIEPVRLLGFPKPAPWPIFGLQWGFYIAIALAVVQYIVLRPSGDLMLKVVPILPSILFYAALNAFNEEIIYRAPMLATVEPVGGSKQALVAVGLLLWHRPLLWHTGRVDWRRVVDFHGLDSGQGHGRDARPLLDVVDAFLERRRHLYVLNGRFAALRAGGTRVGPKQRIYVTFWSLRLVFSGKVITVAKGK
jgi:hypothetical protein